jgi:uncharacterized membrane protein YuzA (DUF378 family)
MWAISQAVDRRNCAMPVIIPEGGVNPRLKKLIGAVLMVVFVLFYALIIMALAPRILTGESKLLEMMFYLVAGLAWVLPLLPLIRWMEHRSNVDKSLEK